MTRWGLAALIVLVGVVYAGPARAHVANEAPPPPTIEGSAYKGGSLTCVAAPGSNAEVSSWAWTRDAAPILDAYAATYVVTGADVGHRLACTQTVSADGTSRSSTSADIEITVVAVELFNQTTRAQRGPTLIVRGVVVADGPAVTGTVELTDLRRPDAIIAGGVIDDQGHFSLSKTIWGLTVGRYSFRLAFVPDDPELLRPASSVISIDARSPRTYPFARSAANRRPTVLDGVPAFWADGRLCSVGCKPRGALAGWPLRPFHEQHMLRAGLNELRPSGFHSGLDVMSLESQSVYPVQTGRVHILKSRGIGAHLRVGNYLYWHLKISARDGQYARAYKTVLGRTFAYYVRHLHFSEVDDAGRYLNPLRPGGRVLEPWADREPPVIGVPSVGRDGSVTVAAFDPQSYTGTLYYATPVLAPAAVAYRVFSAFGTPLTPLEWALRGSQWLPYSLRSLVFAPGSRSPGFLCFAHKPLCIPHWRYRLAGGLAPRLPLGAVHGRTRLTVYAWDWAGNVTARDRWLNRGTRGRRLPATM